MEMASETLRHGDSDDYEVSDEGDRPSGERWAPVGANDGDSDFQDEYKYDCEKYVTTLLILKYFTKLKFFLKSTNLFTDLIFCNIN